MKRLKQCIVENKLPLIIAVIQWFVTMLFQVDRHFFIYDSETIYFLAVKIVYMAVLFILWCFLFFVYKNFKRNSGIYKRWVSVFIIYFSIMLLMLLFFWPGTWSWDDAGILLGVRRYDSFVPWQHIISGCYQAVLLQLLPFPGGIILIQNAIVSVCVAYTVAKLEDSFNIKIFISPILDIVFKLLPFFLPPVLLYQFSGYRMGIYVYLELAMLVMILCGKRDEVAWSWKQVILFGFLAVLTACWRTESLFYAIMMPLFLAGLDRKIVSIKKCIFCIMMIIVGFLGVNKVQNIALGNSNYKIMSLMGPYAAVVRAADYLEDKEYIDAINRVVNVDTIHENPRTGGEALYWVEHAYRDGYTPDEFKDSLAALVKLSIKYPKAVFVERWNVFIRASGITGATWRISTQSVNLFDQDDGSNYDEAFKENGWLPVFKQGRKVLINILSCNRLNGEQIGLLRRIVWNVVIPIFVLICAWLYLLINRKWYLFGICTSVVIRIPIVFLTEPAGWLMYWLSFYFFGYVYLVYQILIAVGQRKGEANG